MADMTFENRPDHIDDLHLTDLCLTDQRLAADVIDRIVSDSDRADGYLGIVVCDEQGRGLQPIVLPDVPYDADAAALAILLDQLLPVVAGQHGSVLVGRGRPRSGVPNDLDRAWHQQTIDSCAAHRVSLLGFFLATRDGVFRLPEPLAAAS